MADASSEFFGQANSFNATLGKVMGGWMNEISQADLNRQVGWLKAVEALATPDKNGIVPNITLHSGIKGPDGKAISGADISFPVVLAMLGEQFAGDTATLGMTMNVEASALDETQGQQSGTATAEGSGSILGFHVGVKVSASFSESEDHKRSSDYRATTTANVTLKRVPTPEPIQRMLQAFMSVVDVECEIAKQIVTANATKVAQGKGLLPKPDDTGGGGGGSGKGG